MAKATVVFASDDKEVVAAIDRMNKKLADLEQKNKQLADASKKASVDAKSGVDATVGSLARMAAGYLSVQTLIQGVNRELEHRNELERGYLDLQKAVASSERDYLRNLGIVSKQQRDAALAGIAGVSERTGVPLKDLYGAGASALSASGGDAAIANAAVEQAARIAPEDSQAIATFAGAIIDLGKAYKTFDPKKGLDLLIGMQSTSRVSDMGMLARNAPRGVMAGVVAGFTPEQAAAMSDTFSNALPDPWGAISATGTANLTARMRAFGEKKGMKDLTGMERFEKISGDASMRKQFLDTLEQSETKAIAELMLTPGTRENQMFKGLSKSKVQAGGQSEQFIAGLNTTELQGTSTSARSIEAIKERYGLKQTEAANEALIRQMYVDLMDKTGWGGWAGYGSMMQYDIGRWGRGESGGAMLETVLNESEEYQKVVPQSGGVFRQKNKDEYTKQDLELLEYFKSMKEDLKTIRQNQTRGDSKTHR